MNPRAAFLTLMGVALSWLCALGCSTEMDAMTSSVAVITPPDAEVDDAGSAPDAAPQGIAPTSVAGSPLCNASTWMGCYPDDQRVSRDKDCGPAAAAAADASDSDPVACRVQIGAGSVPAPACGVAGMATDGMTCTASTDCAAGYECVAGGVCRHYCCAGDCSNQNEFCDIQPLASAGPTNVPVCMPIHDCGLLDQPTDAGSCGAGQTCSVVRSNGARSCVATGSGQAGDSCDTDDCGAGLACIGSAGARHCFVLCHTSDGSPECARKQSCKGGLPLFPVPGVGICQ